MRRGLVIALLAGLMAVPAQVAAAAPPPSTVEVSNVHWVARGVIGLDVSWTCVSAPKGAEWEPALFVTVGQGRSARSPWGYGQVDLSRATCNGTLQTRSLEIVSESGRFHGTRVFVYAGLDASWYIPSKDRYVEQCAAVDLGMVRIRRR